MKKIKSKKIRALDQEYDRLLAQREQIDDRINKLISGMIESGESRLHGWWELSYAQYLTIPRTVMQSMPDAWQFRMAALLEEMDSSIDWRPSEGCYWVKLKDSRGRYVSDSLADYERGRRRLPLKQRRAHATA